MKKTMRKMKFNVKIMYYMTQLVVKQIRIKRICVVLFSLLSVYFTYTLYALYNCVSNKALYIKDLKFNYEKPNIFEINARLLNTKSPFNFCIKNLKTKINVSDETLVSIKKENIEFKQNRDVYCKDVFNIVYNDKFKFSKLKHIKNGKNIELKTSCTVRYNIFGIPVIVPIRKTQIMKQEGTEPFLNILNHSIKYKDGKIDNISIETKLRPTETYFDVALPNLSFTIKINKKLFAIVKLVSYTNDRIYTFDTTICNLKAFSSSLPLLLDSHSFSMTFCDFEFLNSKNKSFNTILENCIKSCEVELSKKKNESDKNVLFTKECSGIDLKIDQIENETINGSVKMHETIINNFVPSHLFLNKIQLPRINLQISVVSKQKSNDYVDVGTIVIDNKQDKTSDYLFFDYVVKLTDLNLLLNQMIQPKKYLKLKVVGDNYIERLFSEIFFLWNFKSKFMFTAQNKLDEIVESKKMSNKKFFNKYELQVEFKDEKKESFCVAKTIKPPNYIEKNEHFMLSWNDLSFKLKNKTAETTVCLEKGTLICMKNFDHISEIFKSNKPIKSNYKIAKTDDNWVNFISMEENEEYKKFNINFTYQTNNTKNNDNIPLSLFYNVKKRDRPTLSRILSRFNVKLGKIKSISDFQIILNSHPIKTQNEYFSLDCKIKTLATDFCIKGSNKNDNEHFASVHIPKVCLDFTISKDILHGISFTCQQKDSVMLNLGLYWEHFEIYNQINFVPKIHMLYFSYFTNSFLGAFVFRRPSTKSINLKNRNLQEITNFTNENLILDFYAEFDKFLKGECSVKFPISSINHSPMVSSNFMWENIEFLILGTKKSEKSISAIRFNKGSLGLRIEENTGSVENGYYQTNDRLSISFCISKNILDAKNYKIFIIQPKTNERYTDEMSLYAKTIDNRHKIEKTSDELKKIIQFKKSGNAMYLTNNAFFFKETKACLNFNVKTENTLVDNLLRFVGNFLNRINLVSYPKNLEVKMNIIHYLKSNAMIEKPKIQLKINEKYMIIYPSNISEVKTKVYNDVCPILTLIFDFKFNKFVDYRNVKKTENEIQNITKFKNSLNNINIWLAIFPHFLINRLTYKLQVKSDNQINCIMACFEVPIPFKFTETYEMLIIVDDQVFGYINTKENQLCDNKITRMFLNLYTNLNVTRNSDRIVKIRISNSKGKIIEYKTVFENETFYYLLVKCIENVYNNVYNYANYKIRNIDFETMVNSVKYCFKNLWNYVKR